jgi:phospholipase/carboxylesterase
MKIARRARREPGDAPAGAANDRRKDIAAAQGRAAASDRHRRCHPPAVRPRPSPRDDGDRRSHIARSPPGARVVVELIGPSLMPRGAVGRIVVLLHGVGADGRDLIELAPELHRTLPDAAFYAPDAPFPCDMAPYGRQWFSLLDRSPAALLAGVRRSVPILDAFLDGLLARHHLRSSRLALVGFSQGTMMALHLAPRRDEAVAAVLGFSGALVGADLLQREIRSEPPVMLIHGDADEVIPVEALFAAVEALQHAELPVQWLVRPGLPHSIDPFGLDQGARFLRNAFAEAATIH